MALTSRVLPNRRVVTSWAASARSISRIAVGSDVAAWAASAVIVCSSSGTARTVHSYSTDGPTFIFEAELWPPADRRA